MQSPLDVTGDQTYWLRSRDVSDSPTIGGDEYFTRHDVARPPELTTDDLPPTGSEAVRELDREALDGQKTIGKRQVTGSANRVAGLWPGLVADAERGTIWAVKATTPYGYDQLETYDDYLPTVSTPNYLDRADAERVRDHPRGGHGVTHDLYYEPDLYTAKGIVAETVDEFGLSVPARYGA